VERVVLNTLANRCGSAAWLWFLLLDLRHFPCRNKSARL